MSNSNATITTTNMELTPMRVNFNGVDLGGTLDNVVVSTEYKLSPIKADQLGDTDLDDRVSGVAITVKTALSEIKFKDNWKVVFPYAKLVTSGGNKMIYMQSEIGDSAYANAHNLLLHPLSLVDGDLSGDFKFFKATAIPKSEITFGPTTQGKLPVEWKIYPDTGIVPARFYIHGDPSIGLIAASFTGPTYVGTGNGTMTSVAVYSGFTLTETITATCIQAITNSGKFLVQGSVSGVLGVATVGTPFVAPEISFTINDGSTDFIVNDAFTIPTTAANYS